MLTRFQFEKITSVIEGTEIYSTLTSLDVKDAALNDVVAGLVVLSQQLAELINASDKYSLPAETTALEFVVTFLASRHSLVLNTELRTALNLYPCPSTWHKPNPPTKYPALLSRWPEESSKISEISSKISFIALDGGDTYRSATFEVIGIGGWMDMFDSSALPATDPTMQLFREGALENLIVARPLWFDPECQPLVRLPDGVDGRSLETMNAEAEWQKALSRREATRKAHEERRKKEIDAIQNARQYAFARFESMPSWKEFVDTALLGGFEPTHTELVDKEPTFMIPGTDRSTWLPGSFVKEILKLEDIVNGTVNWVQLAEDFICAKLASAQPTWFKQTSDGGYKLRPQPLKIREGFDRRTRSIHTGLLKLIRKFGAEDVTKHLLWLKDQPIPAESADEAEDADEAPAAAAAAK